MNIILAERISVDVYNKTYMLIYPEQICNWRMGKFEAAETLHRCQILEVDSTSHCRGRIIDSISKFRDF